MAKPRYLHDLENMTFDQLDDLLTKVFSELRKGLTGQILIGNKDARVSDLESLKIEYMDGLPVESAIEAIRVFEEHIRNGCSMTVAVLGLIAEDRISGIPMDHEAD